MSDQNRRKSQIVATRTMAKVEREFKTDRLTDSELWRLLHDALEEAAHTRRMLGHTDRGIAVVHAQLAARELQLRGTQLELPV